MQHTQSTSSVKTRGKFSSVMSKQAETLSRLHPSKDFYRILYVMPLYIVTIACLSEEKANATRQSGPTKFSLALPKTLPPTNCATSHSKPQNQRCQGKRNDDGLPADTDRGHKPFSTNRQRLLPPLHPSYLQSENFVETGECRNLIQMVTPLLSPYRDPQQDDISLETKVQKYTSTLLV